MLTIGDQAPDFTLLNQAGESVSLSDFAGKKVVVYFYPRDNTPGCSRQAAAFGSAYGQFRDMQVPVVGISKDSVASHQKFAEKYALPFPILSDPERKAIEAYGVWQEKKMCGKTGMGVVRTTFLIDEQGKIEGVWNKVKPDTNPQEILAYLQR